MPALETASPTSYGRDLLLNDSPSAWLVVHGEVNVFLVDLDGGNPSGPLFPILRLGANELFFGLNAPRQGAGLLARPVPGTQIRLLHLSDIPEEHWQRWIAHLTHAAAPSIAPKAAESIAQDQTIEAQDHALIVRPESGLVWVRSPEANAAFLGDENCLIGGERWFPLSASGWILLPPASHLETASAGDAPAFSAQEARAYYEPILLRRLTAKRDSRTKASAERLKTRRTLEAAGLERSLEDLGSQVPLDSLPESVRTNADPVFLACRAVAKAEGIQVIPAPAASGLSVEERVHWVAKASGIRSRRVMLRGEWWKQTSGPLIGVLEDSKAPVALLPRKSGYDILNSVSGERLRVSGKTAGLLEVSAYLLVRPFGQKPLTALEILRFALQGTYSDVAAILAMGALSGALGMVTPIVTGNVFDSIIPGAQRPQLLAVVLFSMSAAISSALLTLVRSIATLRMESQMSTAVQSAVWDRLLNLPATFFRKFTSADLAIRSTAINSTRQVLTSTVTSSILTGVFSLFNFGLLFYYNMKLALVAAALTLFVVAVTAAASYATIKIQRTTAAWTTQLSAVVLQFLNGISKIRVAGAENRAFEQWASVYAQAQRTGWTGRRIAAWNTVFHAIVPVLSSMAIFYAMWSFANGEENASAMSTGHFLAFNSAFGQFFGSVLGVSNAVLTVITTIPILERSKAIFDAVPEVSRVKANPGELTGAIDINHLVFGYTPDKKVLNDLNISIQPGQFVAIVGASGCGKSTLFRMLLGFEKPASGGIYYNGQDLANVDIQAVRKQIGTVLQGSKLMSGDLYRNIVGDLPLNIDDAWEAARLAGLAADLEKMPMGLHTIVGDGGVGLSGGQKQRVMIARAIVSKPRIILFDEATSALDNRTQSTVSRSLEQLSATRVVIAHRLSTIVNADKIYLLDGGKVAEAGTYEELLKQDGLFAALAKRQLA